MTRTTLEGTDDLAGNVHVESVATNSTDPHVLLGRIVDAATDLCHGSTQFKAVGYVDREGVVHWEPGLKPTDERMIYVSRRKSAAPQGRSDENARKPLDGVPPAVAAPGTTYGCHLYSCKAGCAFPHDCELNK